MRRKTRQRQASLFDQVVKGEPAGKSEEEAKPTQSAPEGRGATSESLSVAINDYAIDATDVEGESIDYVGIETIVDGKPVLIEVLPPRYVSLTMSRLVKHVSDDFAVVASMTTVGDDGLTQYLIVKHLTGKYVGQFEMVQMHPEASPVSYIDLSCSLPNHAGVVVISEESGS